MFSTEPKENNEKKNEIKSARETRDWVHSRGPATGLRLCGSLRGQSGRRDPSLVFDPAAGSA